MAEIIGKNLTKHIYSVIQWNRPCNQSNVSISNAYNIGGEGRCKGDKSMIQQKFKQCSRLTEKIESLTARESCFYS